MNPSVIAVRSPNWIGDQAMAYPFFVFLKKLYPKAKIVSICRPWVSSIQFQEQVSDVFVLERPIKGFFEQISQMKRDAKKFQSIYGSPDLSFSLPNSFSAALFFKMVGAKHSVGYKTEGRSFLQTENHSWKVGDELHRAESYVQLLKFHQPGFLIPPMIEFWDRMSDDDMPEVVPGLFSKFDSKKEWKTKGEVPPPDRPYWVLAPGATADSRRWPLDSFRILAMEIAKETNWDGIVVGGPKEAPLSEVLCKDRSLRLYDATARSSVSELDELFRNAKVTVTNESGLSHIASLCGSKVQVICGAADPNRTRPIGPGAVQVAFNPVSCWPCEKNDCALSGTEKYRCLLGITPEQVWGEMKRGFSLIN